MVNPITVDNFAFQFNYTPVGQSSNCLSVGPDFLFNCSVICTVDNYLKKVCFISFLHLNLFVLRDDASIS